jgi:predicted HicB family RNase H-like nuclease
MEMMIMLKKKRPQIKRKKSTQIMFRISPNLKEEVERRAEENNCTMTSYLEFLIMKDLEENNEPKKTKRFKLS